MKVLHLKTEDCNPCPYMAIVGGGEHEERMTVVVCKNRKATVGSRENARVILRQPMSYVLAEVGIPGWCPLPDKDD